MASRGHGRLMLLRMRSNLAAARVRIAFLRLEDEKAGFREDQPRWPRGSGESSGRWSGGAGVAPASPNSAPGPRVRGGHHFVLRDVFDENEFSLPAAARKIFDDGKTGPLPSGGNEWSKGHFQYNKAVAEKLRVFLSERGITGAEMTTQQASEFLQQIKESRDPRIRNFNLRIYMLQIRYFLRFGPAGRE